MSPLCSNSWCVKSWSFSRTQEREQKHFVLPLFATLCSKKNVNRKACLSLGNDQEAHTTTSTNDSRQYWSESSALSLVAKSWSFLRTQEQEHNSKIRSSSPAFAEPNYVKENIRNLTGAVNGKPFLVMANLMNVHKLGDWSKIPKEIDVGYALNKELLNHYIEVLGSFFVGIRHPYHFLLEPKSARKLLENYTYEWK